MLHQTTILLPCALVLFSPASVLSFLQLFPSLGPSRQSQCIEQRSLERLSNYLHFSSSIDQYEGEDDEDEEDEDDFSDADETGLGKFAVDDDGDDPLPPLPQFLNEESDDKPSRSMSMDDTKRMIEEQQKQIDMLMKAVRSQNRGGTTLMELTEDSLPPLPPLDSSLSLSSRSSSVTPLRIMLFIDGTWLYYSIHERPEHLCPIIAKYGRGWQEYYDFNWNELPRIVCEALQEQERNSGWTNNAEPRPMEVSRATVFTSVKKNTNAKSDRLKMFDSMKAAGYDVYMMETTGSGEKCIDIQLAVEMLHYATVPNAYDVAILLSGDKDFMPALIRTRQKARKVGIVSKRPDCNRALYQTPNLIDYDVIWIEDYLDRLFSVKAGAALEGSRPQLSRFTVMKVIYDFIDKSNLPMVSSRDVGRYLKRFPIGSSNIQSEVKRQFRGLHPFIREADVFTIQKIESKEDKTFWISLHSNAEEAMLNEARRTKFSEAEKELFDSYSLEYLEYREDAYALSLNDLSQIRSPRLNTSHNNHARSRQTDVVATSPLPPPPSKQDFSIFTVAKLKEICRDRGLAVSGVKAALIARLEEHDDLLWKQPTTTAARITTVPLLPSDAERTAAGEYLISLVKEYIQASGGTASSRDIGRYLSANSSFASRERGGIGGSETALSELKHTFGSLTKFINMYPELFDRRETEAGPDAGNGAITEFQVSMR